MRYIENGKKINNKAMAKIMFTILFITIMPLIIAFIVYLNAPESQLINATTAAVSGLPALLSANNPELSSIMSTWCKTAPFWGGVVFLLSFKHIQINGNQSVGTMFKGLALFSLLYFPVTYMLLLQSTEITESGKMYRVMSKNDFLLTTLFIMIYTICYISTTYYLVTVAAAFKSLFKK